MHVFKAAVVGAGTMGGEIAQVIAAAGVPVVLKDVEQKFVDQGLEKAREVSRNQLGGLVKKEKISQEQADSQLEEILGRIDGATDYDAFGDVDFVIEAVPERMEIKNSVFGELDVVTPGHAILASNTSSLSITEMGEATSRPDKVVGFHFFYPASMMRLIEVVEGDETSEDTMQPDSSSTGSSIPGSRRYGGCRTRRGSTPRTSTRSFRSRRRPPWGPSSSPTCWVSTPCSTWPSTSATATASGSSCHRR